MLRLLAWRSGELGEWLKVQFGGTSSQRTWDAIAQDPRAPPGQAPEPQVRHRNSKNFGVLQVQGVMGTLLKSSSGGAGMD